jgi:aspartate carbamoyltransferase catalytic subunit
MKKEDQNTNKLLSIILDQVENGVAIRMAVLYLLAAKTQE